MNKNFIPSIYKNDVILPLFTESLRNHLSHEINKQRREANEKMLKDGWGKTQFGEPNPEYYGDYTHRFWNRFQKFLNADFTLKEDYRMSNALIMFVNNCTGNGKFTISALNPDNEDYEAFKYFEGFEFDIENYGKDFYKMGNN